MKPLKSYKTFEAIYQDMRDEGCSDVQQGFAAKPILEKDALGYDKYGSIGFSWDQNQFCCAFEELGDFDILSQGHSIQEYWPYLLKAFILARKPKYLRCSTLNIKGWQELNDALFAVGFLPAGNVQSNHGNYKVNLWEYYK